MVGVEEGSAAAEAGIEIGDQIIEISSVKLTALHIEQCKRLMREQRVRITVTKNITAKEQKRVHKVLEKAKKGASPSTISGRNSASPPPSSVSTPGVGSARGPASGVLYDALDTGSSTSTAMGPSDTSGVVVYDASLGQSDAVSANDETNTANAAKNKLCVVPLTSTKHIPEQNITDDILLPKTLEWLTATPSIL